MSSVPWSRFARYCACLAMEDARPSIANDGRQTTIECQEAPRSVYAHRRTRIEFGMNPGTDGSDTKLTHTGEASMTDASSLGAESVPRFLLSSSNRLILESRYERCSISAIPKRV
jgi:hypothetical protein